MTSDLMWAVLFIPFIFGLSFIKGKYLDIFYLLYIVIASACVIFEKNILDGLLFMGAMTPLFFIGKIKPASKVKARLGGQKILSYIAFTPLYGLIIISSRYDNVFTLSSTSPTVNALGELILLIISFALLFPGKGRVK